MNEILETLSRYNLWGDVKFDLGFIRSRYTSLLDKFAGSRLVKVLVGQRRVGKSYILRQVAQTLVDKGVDKRNIFMLNREMEVFSFVKTDKELSDLFNSYVHELKPQGKIYIFIDEIQNIEGWEHFVNSYSQDYTHEYEVFISGSNSKMLSGQLATLLSGRYVKIEVLPFSYGEFLGYHGKECSRMTYTEYLHSSGMPELYRLADDEAKRYYISSLKDTITLRDVIARYNVRDVALLEDLFVYVVNNASNLLSIGNIVNYMKAQRRKVSYDTVATYLQYLEDAYLIYRVNRYNIRGKNVIGGTVKYYINDLAFRNYLYRGFGYGDGYLLENMVYLDLRRAGFDVYIGNVDNKEVDFVGIKGDRKVYIQTSYNIGDEDTAKREYASLEAINDSYEKYVVTMDEYQLPINNGIRHLQAWNIANYLK